MNAKTIDELCGKPGSFQKFLKEKKAFLKSNEEKRKARIRAVRAARASAWAAVARVTSLFVEPAMA